MKKIFVTLFLITMALVFIMPSHSYAQAASDTVMLYANATADGVPIDQQIKNDQVNNPNPNRVYVLQQTSSIDTVYFVINAIQPTQNLTIIGLPNPITGMLPIIAPGIDPSGGSPKRFINPTVKGIDITLKNLYVYWTTTSNFSPTTGFGTIYIQGDSIKLTCDRCVFDGAYGGASFIYFNASWDKLFLTNCEFRDFQFYKTAGGATHFQLASDTISIKYCTIFSCNGGKLTAGPQYHTFVDIEHNTLFFTGQTPVGTPTIVNGVFKDNIFYCTNYNGSDSSSYVNQFLNGGWDGKFEGNQVFGFDSLSTNGNLSTQAGHPITEADRHIVVENNYYYLPPEIGNYLPTIVATADTMPVVSPVWMNNLVTQMFTDKTTWPNNVAQNNDTTTDPQFDPNLVASIISPMKSFLALYWANAGATITTDKYWAPYEYWDPTTVYLYTNHEVPSDWATTQGYPVPENLRYSAKLEGSDGYVAGDTNWFAGSAKITGIKQVSNEIPSKFELNQNYPNPFNPSTNIKYSVPQSGFVSLKVYNILGQEVATLFAGFQKAGSYDFNFDASKLSSGVYLYRLQSNGFNKTMKMLLLK